MVAWTVTASVTFWICHWPWPTTRVTFTFTLKVTTLTVRWSSWSVECRPLRSTTRVFSHLKLNTSQSQTCFAPFSDARISLYIYDNTEIVVRERRSFSPKLNNIRHLTFFSLKLWALIFSLRRHLYFPTLSWFLDHFHRLFIITRLGQEISTHCGVQPTNP